MSIIIIITPPKDPKGRSVGQPEHDIQVINHDGGDVKAILQQAADSYQVPDLS